MQSSILESSFTKIYLNSKGVHQILTIDIYSKNNGKYIHISRWKSHILLKNHRPKQYSMQPTLFISHFKKPP